MHKFKIENLRYWKTLMKGWRRVKPNQCQYFPKFRYITVKVFASELILTAPLPYSGGETMLKNPQKLPLTTFKTTKILHFWGEMARGGEVQSGCCYPLRLSV